MNQNVNNGRDYVLWMLMILARDIVYKAREKELVQYGITPEQSGVLFAINSLGEAATISELALRLLREPHSVANLLNRMIRNGLITRKNPRGGKRAATYHLTSKGQEAYYHSTKRESLHRVMSALSEEDQARFEQYLRKILNVTFKDIVNEMQPPWP